MRNMNAPKLKRRLITRQDIAFDDNGTGEKLDVLIPGGTVDYPDKINAAHIPLSKQNQDNLGVPNVDAAISKMQTEIESIGGGGGEGGNIRIEITDSMTSDDVNKAISAIPLDLGGRTAEVIFPQSGRSIYSTPISFPFVNNGIINVIGNDFTIGCLTYPNFEFNGHCTINIDKLNFDGSEGGDHPILLLKHCIFHVTHCQFVGTVANSSMIGLQSEHSDGDVIDCQYSSIYTANRIIDNSKVLFNGNSGSNIKMKYDVVSSITFVSNDSIPGGESNMNGVSALVPVGTILPYGGGGNISKSPPDGYLFCDGKSYSRTQYKNLFDTIGTSYGSADNFTFKVPELRSEFLRGWDRGRGVQTRTFGSSEAADTILPSHTHGIRVSGVHASGGSGMNVTHYHYPIGTADDSVTAAPGKDGTGGMWAKWTQTNAIQSASKGGETRPRNVSVNFIIKY